MTPTVLAVCDFTNNTTKVERHLGPLVDVADTTMVCVTPNKQVDGLNCVSGPSTGIRPIDLIIMFLIAIVTARRGDYDVTISFSLVPHGCFALVVSLVARTPVHLGIIGADVDVHAQASYRRLIVALLQRFTVISVPGEEYAETLESLGIPESKVVQLVNPIDVTEFSVQESGESAYDYLWVGRFSSEKQPAVFLQALDQLPLDEKTQAAMVGDGPLLDDVRRQCHRRGLQNVVDFPGWVANTAMYYQNARLFVVTSEREALPLTLLEAMASGCVPVVPRIGNIPDVADHRRTAYLVDEMYPETIAAAIREVESDTELRAQIADNAPFVRKEYSYEVATEDWRTILSYMGISVGQS